MSLRGIDIEDLLQPDTETMLVVHNCHPKEELDDVDMSMDRMDADVVKKMGHQHWQR